MTHRGPGVSPDSARTHPWTGCATLQWSHNGHDSTSNHQPRKCLLSHLIRCWSKKLSKLCVTGLYAGNSLGTGEFPTQMATSVENVSIWWHHHVDLYCTNHPGLVKSSNMVPGISDHNMIIVDSGIRAQQPKKPKRTIKQWSKVDWEAVKEESSKFWDDFLSHHNERTAESNYEAFCQQVNDMITSHVPMKRSNSRHKFPWLTTKLWRMCRKRQRLYNHARKSRKEHHWSTYKSHKKSTTKSLNKARIDYINGILQAGPDKGNSKPFWRYIFSQKNERGGIPALKEDGKLHTGGQKKAGILNKQFTSVFSVDEPGSDNVLSGPSYTHLSTGCWSVFKESRSFWQE